MSRLKKRDTLALWRSLDGARPIRPRPIPYDHKGSTFARDGIRITGSRDFVESVLARLKELLRYEGPTTRLQVSMQESRDRASGALLGSWKCYVQVHQRGGRHAVSHSLDEGR